MQLSYILDVIERLEPTCLLEAQELLCYDLYRDRTVKAKIRHANIELANEEWDLAIPFIEKRLEILRFVDSVRSKVRIHSMDIYNHFNPTTDDDEE